MCDEIIVKKPMTFTKAYEVARTLEATRYTADKVKITGPIEISEQMHKLGIVPSKMKYNKSFTLEIANMQSTLTTSSKYVTTGQTR